MFIVIIMATLAIVMGQSGEEGDEGMEMVDGSGDEGLGIEEETIITRHSFDDQKEEESYRERNMDSIFYEFNYQEMNDNVVNNVTESDPDEVKYNADTLSNVTKENQEDDNIHTEHPAVQNNVDISPIKTAREEVTPDEIFFLSRPLPLTDKTKPEEGPTIKTDVHDFFSLFPINEANISALIGNISSILHSDEHGDNITADTTTVIVTETSSDDSTDSEIVLDITEHSVIDKHCDCDCNLKFKYNHVDRESEEVESDEIIELVLQDNSEKIVCSSEEFQVCCTESLVESLDVSPRIIFPDSPELSENILVDNEGVPEYCQHYIEEATKNIMRDTAQPPTALPTVLDRTQFTTVELAGSDALHLNTTIDSQGQWTVVLQLDQTLLVSIKASARTSLPLFVKFGKNPSLIDFDIMDIMDGRVMGEVSYSMAPGSWYVSLKNEEHYDQLVLLTMTGDPKPGDEDLLYDGCRYILGALHCAGVSTPCVHGLVRNSVCTCIPGWLGAQCDISYQDCRKDRCSSYGECLVGQDSAGYQAVTCQCDPGYQGEECAQQECQEECGEHGVCVGGVCRCYHSWEGAACNVSSVATETVCPSSMLQEEGMLCLVFSLLIKYSQIFQPPVLIPVLAMVPVSLVSVTVSLAGKECPVETSLVIHAVTYMVCVMEDPVCVPRGGVGHTAPWMSVLMPVQAMVSVPTLLQECPGHGLVIVRLAGLDQTAPHSLRFSVMINLTMMKVRNNMGV